MNHLKVGDRIRRLVGDYGSQPLRGVITAISLGRYLNGPYERVTVVWDGYQGSFDYDAPTPGYFELLSAVDRLAELANQ